MDENQFLRLLDELLELEPGSVRCDSHMKDIGWDSLAVVGFIALVDENFGVILPLRAITSSETVRDLMQLLGDHVVPASEREAIAGS
jgi:acyl carrier protein